MKATHLIISLALLTLLVWLNLSFDGGPMIGALPALGWASIVFVAAGLGFVFMLGESARGLGLFRPKVRRSAAPPNIRVLSNDELRELGLEKYRGPSYPHPVIFPDRCIGCQACVDACPHDVLAIVDGRAAAVAPDLCMEDTACQAECPVNPKACIIINTTKEIRSMPTPVRDGASFETNVSGCYIIGDVSGVPLIKNAVKEGSDVIEHIAAQLAASPADPAAEYDVAIIGIGPGGASAAASAADKRLRYIGLEQNNILSTIDLYPKGKYIFFKPDTKDWTGGLPVAGLGLTKAKYGAADGADQDVELLEPVLSSVNAVIAAAEPAIRERVIAKMPASLRGELEGSLNEKIAKELTGRIAGFVRSKSPGDPAEIFRTRFVPEQDALSAQYIDEIVDQLATKIPGDQRENILAVWLGSLAERNVSINEYESCKSITRVDGRDHFVVETEAGSEKTPRKYTARKVVIAIGLRGAPNKLRLPNEDITTTINGTQEPKVIYGLSDPMEFRGRDIVIVGGGNVAVEAAVDLVAVRDGSTISPRRPEDMNRVTLLVRDFLAPTVKFGNKLQLFRCADDGLIDLRFGEGIKELREQDVVLEDVRSKKETGTIRNDTVFALIGGERPNRFLESIGIAIK
jgi:thioredoxin reductase